MPLGFLELVSPSGSSSLSSLLPERVMLMSDPVEAPSESSKSVKSVTWPSGVEPLSAVIAVWAIAFVAAASGSIFGFSVSCAPSSKKTIVGVAGVGGLSLYVICLAPVRSGCLVPVYVPVPFAIGMDAGFMGARGLGGPSDGAVPNLLPTRSSLAYFSAASAYLIASASRRAPAFRLALAALSLASASCLCRMDLRGPEGLGGGITFGSFVAFVRGGGFVG